MKADPRKLCGKRNLVPNRTLQVKPAAMGSGRDWKSCCALPPLDGAKERVQQSCCAFLPLDGAQERGSPRGSRS